MNRRTFNALSGSAALAAIAKASHAETQTIPARSGEGSPINDSDRLIPLDGRQVSIEDENVRVSFDRMSGAMVELVSRKTGWRVQKSAQLAESFRLFAPTPDRSYSPVLGARNLATRLTRSEDGRRVTIVWSRLRSEYSGVLNITLSAQVSVEDGEVCFDMEIKNDSPFAIASVEWPVVGALQRPEGSSTLRTVGFTIGSYSRESSLYSRFPTDINACGINFPTQSSEGRYTLVLAEQEGLYIGAHENTGEQMVKYQFELKPGYISSRLMNVPAADQIGGHPVRTTCSIQHFPFAAAGETYSLPRIVMSPFAGSWHKGVDVYRRWFQSWYKRPPQPAWLGEPHTWQQIQLNSSEDDLRTRYSDLPGRVAQAARAGVRALQITGWNNLGQDRNNPSHDTDPRLGSPQEFKAAIARIQNMGVRVVLFNKYTWADTSTAWYKAELHRYMATDPNGVLYWFHGFKYQTPEQLADINTRRFAVSCLHSEAFRRICAKEFQKSIDLGADGILYDEVMHHGNANYCFSAEHGHRVPASLWSGDLRLGAMFRDMVREARGESQFLLAGEGLYDLETQHYSLSYIRLTEGHVPLARYADPFAPILVAILGFDEREVVNCCLQYRYLMSFESFNFKGDIEDFPLSVSYAQKVEALRVKYRAYLWDAEFCDNQHATVTANGQSYDRFSTFVRTDGKRAAVVVNESRQPLSVVVRFEGPGRHLAWASPEAPQLHPTDGSVSVPLRSAIVLMET